MFLSFLFVLLIDYRFFLILLALSVSTWAFSLKKKLTIFGIVVSILVLALFKYFNFFVQEFCALFHVSAKPLNIFLPLGISFYTFSAIGYLIDVRRGKVDAKRFIDVALYLSFFTKIISGPIVKSYVFFEQEENFRHVGWQTFLPGIQYFVFGIFLKMVLADNLAPFVDQVFETPGAFSGPTILLSVFSYSLQLYFDFSGYSCMAIGISKMLGFDFSKNFNLPYLSHNVTEFWKRWHISLSEWLQEYLYIPLGGNRKGSVRGYFNLVIVMLLGGIWHGANWTFLIWGGLQGISLVAHKLWMKFTNSQAKKHNGFSAILSILLTYLFICFCWIFFRASSITDASIIISRIFTMKSGINNIHLWTIVYSIIYLVFVISRVSYSYCKNILLPTSKTNVCRVSAFSPALDLSKFWNIFIFFSLIILIICFAYSGGSPFIYGNF